MCTGESFHYEGCGHTQLVYSEICSLSQASKINTTCNRLKFAGLKAGVCSSCAELDERITKLRVELKAKEVELNEAILARGGPEQALSNMNLDIAQPKPVHFMSPMQVPMYHRDLSLRGRGKETSRPNSSRSSGMSSFNSLSSYRSARATKVQGIPPSKPRSLSEDISEVVNSWWKEREGYQKTLDAFQVKSLGVVSYRDRIEKCNAARDELLKARFRIAEEDLSC